MWWGYDPGLTPDKHIFVEFLPPWDDIYDELPQYDVRRLTLERGGETPGEIFELKTHYDKLPPPDR